MSDVIQADYEQLEQIASRFANQSQAIEQMLQKVRSSMDKLENDGWVGRGADAFFAEMHDKIIPTCQKLINLLNDASETTKQISQRVQTAEREAAALFNH